MLIAIIILSVALVFLLTIFIIQQKAIDWRQNLIVQIKEEVEEWNGSKMEYEKNYAVQQATRNAYGITGDTFHGIGYILEKGVKYVQLIERLGEYARTIYGSDGKPLSYLLHHELAPDSNYQFPQLDEKQSADLREFLLDIHNGERRPEAILDLISHLLYSDDFERSMQITNISFGKKINQCRTNQ